MSDIETIEITIEDAKAKIAMRDALVKLSKNREFKALVIDGLFKEEAIRLVKLKASPNCQDPSVQADIIKEIDTIGGLNNYFSKVMQMGSLAERELVSHEDALLEIQRHEVEGVA